MSKICVLLLAVPILSGGCTFTPDWDDARVEVDECRLELEELRKQVAATTGDGRLAAQRDRLAAENERLKSDIARLQAAERHLSEALAAAEEKTRRVSRETAMQRQELEQAMARLTHSRLSWEQDLAERQRQIDILTSQVEQLEAKLRQASAPPASTAPAP